MSFIHINVLSSQYIHMFTNQEISKPHSEFGPSCYYLGMIDEIMG